MAMRQKYGDERRTEIATVSGEVDIEDLIPEEECVYHADARTATSSGSPPDTYHGAAPRRPRHHRPRPAGTRILWRSCSSPLRMTISCL